MPDPSSNETNYATGCLGTLVAAAFLIIFLVLPVWPLSPACDRTGLPEYSGHRDAPPGFYRSDRERAAGI